MTGMIESPSERHDAVLDETARSLNRRRRVMTTATSVMTVTATLTPVIAAAQAEGDDAALGFGSTSESCRRYMMAWQLSHVVLPTLRRMNSATAILCRLDIHSRKESGQPGGYGRTSGGRIFGSDSCAPPIPRTLSR